MAPRAKSSPKAATTDKRTKALLEELLECPISPLVLHARGDLVFAKFIAEKGFVHLGQDICSLLPSGREWLRQSA